MIAIPAIDLHDGACVQLVGGSFARERLRIADPLAALATWRAAGFRRVHVVDLDAATGSGENSAQVHELLSANACTLQVGGGVRTTERVDALFAAGADRVVTGTRAIEDPGWLDDIASRHPGRVVVAADVRGRQVVTRGWAQASPLVVTDAIDRLSAVPLGGVLVTAVHVEGRLSGPDLALMDAVVARSAAPVIASGGIATMNDLRALRSSGVAAAVIGMALYTGALDARVVAQEFSE